MVRYNQSSRAIRLLNTILNHKESTWMTLSGAEEEIKKNAANVRLVNKVSKNTLGDIIPSDQSSWLQAQEMLRYASTVTTEDDAKSALDLLRAAYHSDLDFKPGILNEVVKMAREQDIPPEWALSGFIGDKPNRENRTSSTFFINKDGI